MPRKTILVRLTDDPDRMPRLDCADGLADRFGAHVTALYLSAPLATAASMAGAMPAAWLVAWKNARESVRAMRHALPFLIEAEDVTILTVLRCPLSFFVLARSEVPVRL